MAVDLQHNVPIRGTISAVYYFKQKEGSKYPDKLKVHGSWERRTPTGEWVKDDEEIVFLNLEAAPILVAAGFLKPITAETDQYGKQKYHVATPGPVYLMTEDGWDPESTKKVRVRVGRIINDKLQWNNPAANLPSPAPATATPAQAAATKPADQQIEKDNAEWVQRRWTELAGVYHMARRIADAEWGVALETAQKHDEGVSPMAALTFVGERTTTLFIQAMQEGLTVPQAKPKPDAEPKAKPKARAKPAEVDPELAQPFGPDSPPDEAPIDEPY